MKEKFHVAHILLSARHEAEDLLRKLKDGKSFEDLARKHSSCSSAANGGDLGEITVGKADPDFEEAALNIKTGEISKTPVRTRFGFHLIKRIK